jgi:hypothetical protein
MVNCIMQINITFLIMYDFHKQDKALSHPSKMEVGSDVSRTQWRKQVQYVSYETEPLNYVTFKFERFKTAFQREKVRPPTVFTNAMHSLAWPCNTLLLDAMLRQPNIILYWASKWLCVGSKHFVMLHSSQSHHKCTLLYPAMPSPYQPGQLTRYID